MNHVEIRISVGGVEVWASNPGQSHLVEIADAEHLHLPLTRGLVWMEDNHYNADKFNTQQSNTFAWDDFGFDGPVLPRDLGFDVPDQGSRHGAAEQLGWATGNGSQHPVTVTAPGVRRIQDASGALVVFNWFAVSESVPSVRVNGHPPISSSWQGGNPGTYAWRTIAVQVPLSEIRSGSNRITFQNAPNGFANVDIILQGAGGTPTCLDPSTCGVDGGSA